MRKNRGHLDQSPGEAPPYISHCPIPSQRHCSARQGCPLSLFVLGISKSSSFCLISKCHQRTLPSSADLLMRIWEKINPHPGLQGFYPPAQENFF